VHGIAGTAQGRNVVSQPSGVGVCHNDGAGRARNFRRFSRHYNPFPPS
jgi:hypothetical protein